MKYFIILDIETPFYLAVAHFETLFQINRYKTLLKISTNSI